MSSEQESAPLRRSTRTVIPTTPFTIDFPPPLKQKKLEPVQHQLPIVPEVTVGPPVQFNAPDVMNPRTSNATTTENGVPLTMYSNRNLETVTKDQKVVGTILHQNLEDLRGKGMNITVKQLLAKNFKNYRVRQSLTSERATEIVNRTLSENDVPDGALLSGPPFIPPNIRIGKVYQPRKRRYYPKTLQSALESLVANAPAPETIMDDYVPIKQEDTSLEPIAYPGNCLPWPVFWKQVPNFLHGDIYLFVDDVIYTPMSDIIKAGKFLVPLDEPVGFTYNERPVEATLNDMLLANGINLSKAQHYRMLQGLLQKAGVHIRVDYAERLHKMQTIRESGGYYVRDSTLPPITITSDKLPLICQHPEVYISALGKRIHGAVLVDTSGDKEPLPFQTFLTTIYTEPLPLNFRRQILILYDLEVPIEQISARFGCSVRSVQETIGTRILIERHLVDQHLLDEPTLPPRYASPDATTSPTIGEVMRPRSKIRRTHYVDLNKLVWKHFKECQNSGIQINGKHLKDQAMRYAKEMGLESFRGSEGWLDAFKRRHRIDLKTMTGFPVCYESDMYEEVDKECREDISPSLLDHHHQQHHVFGHQNGPDEFAASFFSSLANFPPPMMPEVTTASTSTSNHLQNMINSMMTPSASAPPPNNGNQMNPSTSSSSEHVDSGHGNGETIFNVMRSCQIKVADKEVSHALDTLRAFILAHDPAAMSLLVPLQERLALTTSAVAANDMSST